MKRIMIFIVVIAGLVLTCTGCSALAKGVCDGCGQTEVLREFNNHGSIQHYCDDCYRFAKLLY